MIASLEGIVTEKFDDNIVISVGGVGFRVNVSMEFAEKVEIHKVIALFTYLVVREDALALYGFESQQEMEMFTLLLSVSGVGPRTAMLLVSATPIDQIKRAVLNEQPELLGKVAGIGKKTAQSIVLHLQGKIKGEKSYERGLPSSVDNDVIAALNSLGYSLIEAQAAVQMIPGDSPDDLESRVRIALKYFS